MLKLAVLSLGLSDKIFSVFIITKNNFYAVAFILLIGLVMNDNFKNDR